MKPRALVPVTLSAALLITACSSPDSATPEAPESSAGETQPAADGAVSLTHPSIEGLEIAFDAQPQTLVMDCYAYSSFSDYDLQPAALFGFDCENPNVMGDADISGIEFVGKDGEINMEKLAELRPDAIIGNGGAEGWSWFDEDVNGQLLRVAPFVPLPSGGTVDENIANTRSVAEFLGGDTESEAIAAADEEFAAAKEAFSAAAEGKDLNFMLASPVKEMLYSGVGFAQADLLEELGANIVGAPKPEQGNPWGQIAWEEASTYPTDVFLIEGYNADNPEEAFTTELWEDLPAVRAGQISGWYSKGAMTSRSYAAWLNTVAELTSNAQKVS